MARYQPLVLGSNIEYKVYMQTGNNVWTHTFYGSGITIEDVQEMFDAIVALLKAIYRIVVIIRRITARKGAYNPSTKQWVADGTFQETVYIQEPCSQADSTNVIPYRNVLNVHFDAEDGNVATRQFPVKIVESSIDNGVINPEALAIYQGAFDTFKAAVADQLCDIRTHSVSEVTVDNIPGSNRIKRY